MTTGANAPTIRPGRSGIRAACGSCALADFIELSIFAQHTQLSYPRKAVSSTPQLRDRPPALAAHGLTAVVLMPLIHIKGFVKLVAPAACIRRI
jgi:hypothetical protein